MVTPPRVLLIGGSPTHLLAAKAAGLDVVYCQFPDEFAAVCGPLVLGAVLADYTDWDTLRPLVVAAFQTWGFTAAVSLTEPGLDPAARVNDLFGLGGTSYEVSHRFTDKNLMRRRIAEHVSADLRAIGASVVTDRDSLVDFGAAHGYPFIVKPTAGTASYGVHRVLDESMVPAVWDAIGGQRDSDHPLTYAYDLQEYVMEEYADGPLYSAEAFSFAGRHTVLAITEAVTLEAPVVHVGHVLPARLDPEVEHAVVATATAFLDAVGHRDGPSHTEITVGTRGPVVIESQNRIGGALINEMVASVYGVDMRALTMGWPHGTVEPITTRPTAAGAAASWLIVAEPGEVVEIGGVADVVADPDTIAVDLDITQGEVVRPLDGQWDGLGHVAVRAVDADTAVDACRTKLGDIKIHTRPVD
jgi:biotin carboxylase